MESIWRRGGAEVISPEMSRWIPITQCSPCVQGGQLYDGVATDVEAGHGSLAIDMGAPSSNSSDQLHLRPDRGRTGAPA